MVFSGGKLADSSSCLLLVILTELETTSQQMGFSLMISLLQYLQSFVALGKYLVVSHT